MDVNEGFIVICGTDKVGRKTARCMELEVLQVMDKRMTGCLRMIAYRRRRNVAA
jgi:hypothetical protein